MKKQKTEKSKESKQKKVSKVKKTSLPLSFGIQLLRENDFRVNREAAAEFLKIVEKDAKELALKIQEVTKLSKRKTVLEEDVKSVEKQKAE